MTRVETLLFDLGNVLIFHDNQRLFRKLGELAGLSIDEVERLVSGTLWEDIHTGAINEEETRHKICAALGIHLTPEEFFEVWNCHFRVNEDLLPQVERLVGRVKLFALSNTNAIHARYFSEHLPILRKFDRLLFSHELKLAKPDPRIYREALRQAGSLPDATAYFDDIPDYVQSARQLGIRGYVFRSVPEFASQLAELGLSERDA